MKTALLLALLLFVGAVHAQVPLDKVPTVDTLPSDYPDTWIFAHDAAFYSLIAGKVAIVDVAADTQEYKGAIGAAQFATFNESSTRDELYVSETFYSRGVSGERTDVVSVYAKDSLDKTAEIVLPGDQRAMMVTKPYASRLIGNDEFLIVYNFNPASSAAVVDVAKREVVNEVSLNGCALLYPTGERSFTSLCGDGSFVSIQLDEQGKESSRFIGKSFFNSESDPVFDYPIIVDGIAYFITYNGIIRPLDLRGSEPVAMDPWSLVPEGSEYADWGPSGWQIIASDGGDMLYVIMEPGRFDGSHKSGGGHIMMVSRSKKSIVGSFEPTTPAFSVIYVDAQEPLLAVTNVNMTIDVYTSQGEFLRNITLGASAMPFALQAKR
ncbi:MAG: amine dehydrogenase large subunit [Pseudomonadota bacterium]